MRCTVRCTARLKAATYTEKPTHASAIAARVGRVVSVSSTVGGGGGGGGGAGGGAPPPSRPKSIDGAAALESGGEVLIAVQRSLPDVDANKKRRQTLRYRLDKDGSLRRAGQLSDDPKSIVGRCRAPSGKLVVFSKTDFGATVDVYEEDVLVQRVALDAKEVGKLLVGDVMVGGASWSADEAVLAFVADAPAPERVFELALRQLERVDAVLERLALLWDSTEVVFDTLLQKSEHIEKFLEFAREPQLLVRFRQRLAEYKQFWVDVQSVSRATLQESPRNAPPVTF
mgnify:CR=1 FL=1